MVSPGLAATHAMVNRLFKVRPQPDTPRLTKRLLRMQHMPMRRITSLPARTAIMMAREQTVTTPPQLLSRVFSSTLPVQ
jgi:hypothetical protein